MTQMPNFFGMETTEKSSYSKPPALCTRGSTTEESESAAKTKSDVKMEATLGDPWKKTANRQEVPDMFAPPVFDGVHQIQKHGWRTLGVTWTVVLCPKTTNWHSFLCS